MNLDRLKILWVQKYLLFPTDAGAKKRSLNILTHLAKWHDVTYLCNFLPGEESQFAAMRSIGLKLEAIAWSKLPRGSPRFYAQLLKNLFCVQPFALATNLSPHLRRRAKELIDHKGYDLLICDTVVMAPHVLDSAGVRRVLFQHNVEAQILERHAKTGGFLKRQYMRLQWRKMERYERMVGDWFGAFIAVSELDRQRFASEYGWKNTFSIDTAVDTDYFQPVSATEVTGRILFLGSLDWMPNQEGVRFFVDQVWPAIRKACPQAEFHIVGRNPPDFVHRLSQRAGVRVVGTVPDVRPYLAEASVVVVPLLVGGGTRIKVFEAMAMEKAVVSTSIGAEGLDVTPGEQITIADDPHEFSRAVIRLLEHPEERRRIAQQGRKVVGEKFSAERVARQFHDICLSVCGAEQFRARRTGVANACVGKTVQSSIITK
jgi:glycosyltransferase involved in cell wall biosynthesis